MNVLYIVILVIIANNLALVTSLLLDAGGLVVVKIDLLMESKILQYKVR